MTEIFTNFYLGGKENLNSAHFDNLTNMITDAYIWYGGHKQTEWAAMNGDNVYQYIFKYKDMLWLDSTYPVDSSDPGAVRGSCATTSGAPDDVEKEQGSSKVMFSDIRWGPLGSTTDGPS